MMAKVAELFKLSMLQNSQASKLNGLLRFHSSTASLVMLSLPAEPNDDDSSTAGDGDDCDTIDSGTSDGDGAGSGGSGGAGSGGGGGKVSGADFTLYLELLEELMAGLDRVVMVRGGGSEVVTIFN
jgi:hypothetical protein